MVEKKPEEAVVVASEKVIEKQSAVQISRPAPIFVSSEERLSQFSEWLLSDRNLAANTAVSYASSLKSADAYAREHGILSVSLITSADEVLVQAVERLFSDEDFVEYNSNQHNRFSAALNAFFAFRLGDERLFRQLIRKRKKQEGQKKHENHKKVEPEVLCPDELRELLVKKFPYGIRPDSSIDIMKLRGSAGIFGVELSEDDELLKKQIAAGGDEFEGKIYFIADDTLEEMENRVRAIFDTGVCVIYYDKLYDCDFTWFDEHHISSSDHVRELLKSHMEDVFCSKNFIRIGAERINELEAVEGEFKRIWGGVRNTHL